VNWDERILGPVEPASILDAIDLLFESQVEEWPELRHGVEGLTRARSRDFVVNGFPVVARHIPHRIGSTTARVDPDAIRKRACFLCAENLPEPEKGLVFDQKFVIACNPFPILNNHLSIVLREHVPQRIEGHLMTMLDLAVQLPGYVVLYNGPECGASAPDHMHFQACLFDEMPLVEDLKHASGGLIPDYPRSAFVLRDSNPVRLSRRFSELFVSLEAHHKNRVEPMFNLVALHRDGDWVVVVFPRSKHRPEVFHTGELTWTPGAIDLCGVVVLPVESDLDKITASDIQEVFGEVSLEAQTVEAMALKLGLV
jgi:hypothetical protein